MYAWWDTSGLLFACVCGWLWTMGRMNSGVTGGGQCSPAHVLLPSLPPCSPSDIPSVLIKSPVLPEVPVVQGF